ncbi:MAG: hypothetical protein ACRDSJ_25610 [Rubrobacteraceae bacterium]
MRTSITPSPTPEEAAAIMAALETLRDEGPEKTHNLKRGRWRMAGLLGHPPPRRMEPGDSLWSYSRWEGMV